MWSQSGISTWHQAPIIPRRVHAKLERYFTNLLKQGQRLASCQRGLRPALSVPSEVNHRCIACRRNPPSFLLSSAATHYPFLIALRYLPPLNFTVAASQIPRSALYSTADATRARLADSLVRSSQAHRALHPRTAVEPFAWTPSCWAYRLELVWNGSRTPNISL